MWVGVVGWSCGWALLNRGVALQVPAGLGLRAAHLPLPAQLSYCHLTPPSHSSPSQELRLYTDYGRCCRPLFIVEDQAIKVGGGMHGLGVDWVLVDDQPAAPLSSSSAAALLHVRLELPNHLQTVCLTACTAPVPQVKKRDIINLQNREETGFSWQSMIEAGYIE